MHALMIPLTATLLIGCTDGHGLDGVDHNDAAPAAVPLTFRVVQLDFAAPPTAADPFFALGVQAQLQDYALNWLVQIAEREDGTCSFLIGSTVQQPQTCDTDCTTFSSDLDYPPVAGIANCSSTEFRIPASGFLPELDIAIRNHEGAFAVPFRHVVLTGSFADDSWQTATGSVEATIALEDAGSTYMGSFGLDMWGSDLQMTLCGALGLDIGNPTTTRDDCQNIVACLDDRAPPDSTWDCTKDGYPPDASWAGAPAWRVLAEIEAHSLPVPDPS